MEESGKINCLDKGFVRLVDSMGDDSSIVQMARVSYGKGTKTPSDDRRLIRYLMSNRHTSPFESVTFKFHVKAPIFVLRQWMRHRTWSYNEVSARYSEMPDEFYIPETQRLQRQSSINKQGSDKKLVSDIPTTHALIEDHMRMSYETYCNLIRQGLSRELARIVLPVSQYSEMYAVTNLNNLLHFIRLREDTHAQAEIREYAIAMKSLIGDIVPITLEAYKDYCEKK